MTTADLLQRRQSPEPPPAPSGTQMSNCRRTLTCHFDPFIVPVERRRQRSRKGNQVSLFSIEDEDRMPTECEWWNACGVPAKAAELEPEIRELFANAGVAPTDGLVKTLGLMLDGAYWSGQHGDVDFYIKPAAAA